MKELSRRRADRNNTYTLVRPITGTKIGVAATRRQQHLGIKLP